MKFDDYMIACAKSYPFKDENVRQVMLAYSTDESNFAICFGQDEYLDNLPETYLLLGSLVHETLDDGFGDEEMIIGINK